MLANDDPLYPGQCSAPPQAMLAHWGERLGHHRGPLEFWAHFGLGSRAQGLIQVPDPEWLAPVLDTWLGGPAANRVPLAYTGLGDILYFRDLGERARSLGMDEEDALAACDVSLLCTRYKRVQVLAHSMEAALEDLSDPGMVEEWFDASLYAEGVELVGAPGPNQILGFVPALALGGSPVAASLQPLSAPEHWDILFQL